MNIIDLTGENRNNLMVPSRRRCSFCRIHGHNISTCNDNRLTNFERECRIEKQHCEFSINPRTMFRNWLCDKSILSPYVVQSFAVRKCGSRMSNNMNVCIDNIIDYIYQDTNVLNNIISNINVNRGENLIRNINYVILSREINSMLEAEILLGFRDYIFQNDTSLPRDNKFTFVSKLDKTNDSEEICDCAICYEDDIKNINFVKLNCNHKFCNTCLKKAIESTQNNKTPCCALCRSEIKTITFKDENIKKEFCKFSK
jgi:hypothetical protein